MHTLRTGTLQRMAEKKIHSQTGPHRNMAGVWKKQTPIRTGSVPGLSLHNRFFTLTGLQADDKNNTSGTIRQGRGIELNQLAGDLAAFLVVQQLGFSFLFDRVDQSFKLPGASWMILCKNWHFETTGVHPQKRGSREQICYCTIPIFRNVSSSSVILPGFDICTPFCTFVSLPP